MKYLPENNRLLETVLTKMNQQMKRIVKFHKEKLSEYEIINLSIDYLTLCGKMLTPQLGKENTTVNIDTLKVKNENKSILISEWINQKTHESINTQRSQVINSIKSVDEIQYKVNVDQNKVLNSFTQNTATTDLLNSPSILENIQMTMSYTELPPLAPKRSTYSYKPKNSIESTRRPSQMSFGNRFQKEDRLTMSREKSKTFLRLNKIVEKFCVEAPSRKISRNKYINEDFLHQKKEKGEKEILVQQNLNLKAMNASLMTHVNLLQKYKYVPSVQALIQKQQLLKKKEESLRSLQDDLSKRQLKINKSHCEVIKKERSLKIL